MKIKFGLLIAILFLTNLLYSQKFDYYFDKAQILMDSSNYKLSKLYYDSALMTNPIGPMEPTSSQLKSGTLVVESPSFISATTHNKFATSKVSSLTWLCLMSNHQMKLFQNLLSVQQLETDRLSARLPR